jgi:hypothetical protein
MEFWLFHLNQLKISIRNTIFFNCAFSLRHDSIDHSAFLNSDFANMFSKPYITVKYLISIFKSTWVDHKRYLGIFILHPFFSLFFFLLFRTEKYFLMREIEMHHLRVHSCVREKLLLQLTYNGEFDICLYNIHINISKNKNVWWFNSHMSPFHTCKRNNYHRSYISRKVDRKSIISKSYTNK